MRPFRSAELTAVPVGLMSGRTRQWRHRVLLLVPPLGYLGAALAQYSRFLADPAGRIPGGSDGVLYGWYFEWMYRSVQHLNNPLFTGALNAPSGVNTMWNTSMPLLAFVCIPLTATIGPLPTVGLLFVSAPFLSATSAYLVLRRITGSAVGSAVAGMLFGFGPFWVGHFGHLNLILDPLLPPILLLLRNLVVTQTRRAVRAGALLGALVGAQLLVSEEIVVLAAAAAIPLLAWLVLLNIRAARRRWRHATLGLAAAAGVALLIAGVPLGYQLLGPLALRSGITTTKASADLASLVRPSLLQRFAPQADVVANLHYRANGAENTGYLGWLLIVLCVVLAAQLIAARERFGSWWLLSAASVVALSLGSRIYVDGTATIRGPWAAYRLIPFVHSADPIRMSLITTLLVGWLIAHCMSRASTRGRIAIAAAITLALVPLWPIGPYTADLVTPTPRFFRSAAVDAIPRNATAMVLPVPSATDTRAMVWQMSAGMRFRLIGGYSVFQRDAGSSYFARVPIAWYVFVRAVLTRPPTDRATLMRALHSLQQFGVRYVVIPRELADHKILAATARAMTGCVIEVVSDVDLCAVPRPQ